ncbi:hypothetical protein [Actinokineospora inagensis]|uniref:hypothetical protein n=1 Tax=Actinokineospora inagensis TaxID=103730 RepID=UPI0004051E1E|nr:hypothetical protein [Actinokineospora inagensis]
MNLVDAAWALADQGVPGLRERLGGPLRVGVTGAPGSGRSTVVAALTGGPFEVVDGPADVRLHLVRRPDDPVDADPVATIVVLARADELGGGRLDALDSARLIAAEHTRLALGEQCQLVVATAALPAVGSRQLTRADATALSTLASREDLLLSADRLTHHLGPDLLHKLGLFGTRAAVAAIHRGDPVPATLLALSGIPDLRQAIDTYFLPRAEMLQARAALRAIAHHPEAERALASAHEPRELRLLADLDTARVTFTDLTEEARCLLGAYGTAPATRLSATGDPFQAHRRWQALTEAPHLSHRERQAAATVARSCEALVAVGVVD